MNKALLIIDMQKGSFTKDTPRHDTAGVCSRINKVGHFFRDHDWTIIHIQHDGSKEGVFLPESQDWSIIEEIEVGAKDLNIQKTANDAFLHSKLDSTLKDRGISEIWVSGCASDFCVNATILSALAKDYHVNVLSDCHTTADRLNLKAKDVIALFNHIWSDLTPTGGEVKLKSSASFLSAQIEIR